MLHSQKYFLQVFIAERFILTPLKGDTSLFHDIYPVGQLGNLRNVLFHQQHGLALLIDLLDGGENFISQAWNRLPA
jgi:hypothetical protein